MSNVLERRLIRMAAPLIPGMMDTLQEMILDYKQSIPLLPGESHIAGKLHEQDGEIFVVVCAFTGDLISRKIRIIKSTEILKLIEDGISKS